MPPCSPAKLRVHGVGEEGTGKDDEDRGVQGDREAE